MTDARPLVRRIDHVYARVEDPAAVFAILTERLGLPRSYGFARVPILDGGAVSIGDLVFLEVLRYAPGHRVTPPAKPGLNGLALDAGVDLRAAASELSRRGIAHSPPYTYAGDPTPFAFGMPLERAGLRADRGPLWSMVMIGGVLGERRLARMRPLLPRRGGSVLARLDGAIAGKVMSSKRIGPFAVARSIGSHPTVWLHRFDAADMDRARVAATEELDACAGGPLGIKRVAEVVLSAEDAAGERERWERLLSPTVRELDGAWHFPEGPALRLVEGSADVIEALVCEVESLAAAEPVLKRSGLLGQSDADELRIAPAALQGLDIRLRERTPVAHGSEARGLHADA